MTFSDRVSGVRARTHTNQTPSQSGSSSGNASGRPTLRVIPGGTHTETATPAPRNDHAPSKHLADVPAAVTAHPIAANHPPTIAEALENLWPGPDETRHGLAGQLASAAAGLAQLLILGLAWGAAHAAGSSKARAAWAVLALLLALTVWAVAAQL